LKIGGPQQVPRRGVLLYEGASVLGGGPIFVVATFGTKNRKTGALVQTWIMRADMHPVEASRTGADDAICGSCPHRALRGSKRSCYVNLAFGPRGVWEAYQLNKYVRFDTARHKHYFAGQLLRAGAYGDPVAVPAGVWQPLVDAAYQTVSYTHLWRLSEAEPFKAWTMASVDSVAEREEAKELGWRTYRVSPDLSLGHDEIWCPATEPGGNRALCETCMACDGHMRGSRRVDIASPVHGKGSNHFKQWSETRELERRGIKQLELFDE